MEETRAACRVTQPAVQGPIFYPILYCNSVLTNRTTRSLRVLPEFRVRSMQKNDRQQQQEEEVSTETRLDLLMRVCERVTLVACVHQRQGINTVFLTFKPKYSSK